MTNPKNKFTKEEFLKKAKEINDPIGLEIIIDTYQGVDYYIDTQCSHGKRKILGWQLLKPRNFCCRKSYYNSGKMWASQKYSIQDWINILRPILGENYNWKNVKKTQEKDILQLECKEHGVFQQWTTSLKNGIGCKFCVKDKEKIRKQQQAWENFIESGAYLTGRSCISKAETKWLDELGIATRQKLLEDIGLTVDGYDESTNTVYLYHGRFWHGCPETYDPEMQHPVIKIKMKDLYHQTMIYEQRIKDAGYNLVTTWGT